VLRWKFLTLSNSARAESTPREKGYYALLIRVTNAHPSFRAPPFNVREDRALWGINKREVGQNLLM
jgi:hypothetical protein